MNAVSTDVVPYQQLERMAQSVAKSNMFGAKNADQALALMLLAQAEGIHPMKAVQEYHLIEGKPAMRSDAMLARFQSAGGRVQWKEHTDQKVVGVFSHPSGGTLEVEWSIERAKAAGLTNKNTWKSYPRQMLRARCISEGVRAVFPGIATGVYTVEEAQDMEPVDVTPQSAAQRMDAAAQSSGPTPLTAEEREEHERAMREAADEAHLRVAFATAWKHATEAEDQAAAASFKALYDGLKGPQA